MGRGRRGRKGKSGKGKGLSTNADADLTSAEITLGIEKAGVGASVTFSATTMKVSLGIGVMAVEIDLGEINNSTVSYAFDLYDEIEGTRDGCSVTLRYKMAGQFVKSETRKIPDCKDENDGDDNRKQPNDQEENEPDEDFGGGRKNPPNEEPSGNLWDKGFWLLAVKIKIDRCFVSLRGLWGATIHRSSNSPGGSILEIIGNKVIWKGPNADYIFTGIYIQPHSFYDGMIPREGYPLETRRYRLPGPYKTTRHENMNPKTEPKIYSIGGNQKVVRFTVANLKYYINRHQYSNEMISGKSQSYGGFSSYVRNSYQLKILDEKIIERNFPARKGGSRINDIIDRKNKKRGQKMDSKCCDMIKRIYSILAAKELLNEGFNIPKKWYAPEAKGTKKLTNYLEIQEYQMRMLDHYGVGTFLAEIADADLVKKGKQKAEIQTVNGTDAIKQILENTLKNDTSNKALIKVLGSMLIALAEIAVSSSSGTRVSQEILQFLGAPVRSESFTLNLPFNIKALKKE